MKKSVQLSKKDSITEILPYLAIFWLAISLGISLEQQDLRWIASGIFAVGVFYFGAMFVIAIKKFDPEDRVFDKCLHVFLILILANLALFICLYGVAVFLHHYDIDGLINVINRPK